MSLVPDEFGEAAESLRALGDTIRCDHDHLKDKTPAELRESAYRRGFQQGYCMARKLIEEGGTVEQLAEHELRIHQWREHYGEFALNDRAVVIKPPWPGSPPWPGPGAR